MSAEPDDNAAWLAWLAALDGLMRASGTDESQLAGSDPESWRFYYNEGYSPEDAWIEDQDYADADDA